MINGCFNKCLILECLRIFGFIFYLLVIMIFELIFLKIIKFGNGLIGFLFMGLSINVYRGNEKFVDFFLFLKVEFREGLLNI